MATTGATNSLVTIDYDIPEWFNMATMLVDRHVTEGRGQNPAIYYEDRVLSYADLLAAVNRVGNVLHVAGVGREERVVLLMADCPEFVATYVAAMKIGAVPLPINTALDTGDLTYCLADSCATTLVVDFDFLPSVQAIRSQLPELAHIAVRTSGPGQTVPAGYIDFNSAVERASSELQAARTHRDDPSYWLYSSGTTGKSKGVIHLHEDMVFCVGRWLDAVGMPGAGELHYSASKLPFSYGLVNSLYAPLMAGASVVLVAPPSRPQLVADTIARYHPARFYSTPALFNMLLHEDEAGTIQLDTSSLRYCVSAGEALPPAIYEHWHERFGLELLDGIGSTENGYIYIQNLPGKSRAGMSGQLLPGYAVELRDENGMAVPEGEDGELYLRSPSTAIGYWRKREQTKETFCGNWLKTGDRYERAADDYLRYLGRADDMFKTNGQWVSPLEVEDALLRHDAVADAAVIGALDADGLVKPKAFVVLKSQFSASDELIGALQDHCKELLAPDYYKYPRMISFSIDLPKNANNKKQRFRLRGQ